MRVADLTKSTASVRLKGIAVNGLLTTQWLCYVHARDNVLCQVLLLQPAFKLARQQHYYATVFNTETGEIEDWTLRQDAPVLVTWEDDDDGRY